MQLLFPDQSCARHGYVRDLMSNNAVSMIAFCWVSRRLGQKVDEFGRTGP